MKIEGATLKDIARAVGVSATTVHRALQGKEGVGEDARKKIQRVAAEMGYRSNYMAAALKRKTMQFAIAFPAPDLENKYYYHSLWQGAREFLKSVEEFNIVAREFPYPLVPGSNGAVLKDIYEKSDDVDGVITMAVDNPQSSYFIDKLAEKNIPVVLVGADLHKESRFCCVKSFDELAGSLAAELLTAFLPGDARPKIMITGNLMGSLAMPDQYYNSLGFEQYMEANMPNATVYPAYNSNAAAA